MAHFCVNSVAEAIVNDNLIELRRLITKRKRMDTQDNLGYTWLHLAVKKNSDAIVNILLRIPGLNINTPNFEGFTPLLLACDNATPNLVIIKNLLNNKANVNGSNHERITSLHFACKHKSLALVKLLHEHGANLNCSDFNHYTPLHYALEQQSLDIITYLLENHANANLTESHGLNALMFAIIFARDFTTVIFPHITNVNAVTIDGRSALALACYKQHISAVEMLLDAGAYVSLEADENSPLYFTFKTLNYQLFQLVWNAVKGDVPHCTCDFIYEAIKCWSFGEVRFYKLLLRTPGLNLYRKPNILKRLFQKDRSNIDYLKPNIYCVVSMFLDNDVLVENIDILYFIIYFKRCYWAADLLDLILCRTQPQYSKKLINICLERNMIGEALVLLKYCYCIDSDCLYKQLYINPVLAHIRFFIKYFTPSNTYRLRLVKNLEHLGRSNEVITALSFHKIASLKEICRDVFRTNLLKNTGYNREFFDTIEALEIPLIIKDILRFRVTLYNFSFKYN